MLPATGEISSGLRAGDHPKSFASLVNSLSASYQIPNGMIITSLMTRVAFLGSLSSSFGTTVLVANTQTSSADASSSATFVTTSSSRPTDSSTAELPTIATSYICPNIRNAPQSSSMLTSHEQETMMALGARTVRGEVATYLRDDPTLAGPLLRLAFHDAATREACDDNDDVSFTGGANGSIRYELEWSENRGLQRPLKVAEQLHDKVEGYLSLADTVALAGAAAVECAGGPHIAIRLGRIDSKEADAKRRRKTLRMDTDRSVVDTTLPSAALDSDGLRLYFAELSLTEEEFVALSGAHDLGRHVTLLDMPKSCLKNLTRECLENAPVLMPFVSEEPDRMSNTYFQKLLKWYDRKVEMGEVAFIPTDVALVVDTGLRKHVQKFANDERAFFRAFLSAYQKLVDTNAQSSARY